MLCTFIRIILHNTSVTLRLLFFCIIKVFFINKRRQYISSFFLLPHISILLLFFSLYLLRFRKFLFLRPSLMTCLLLALNPCNSWTIVQVNKFSSCLSLTSVRTANRFLLSVHSMFSQVTWYLLMDFSSVLTSKLYWHGSQAREMQVSKHPQR